jgi:hypothetical protein
MRVPAQRERQTLLAVFGDFSSPNLRLWKYYPHHLFRRIFKKMQPQELPLKDYFVARSGVRP